MSCQFPRFYNYVALNCSSRVLREIQHMKHGLRYAMYFYVANLFTIRSRNILTSFREQKMFTNSRKCLQWVRLFVCSAIVDSYLTDMYRTASNDSSNYSPHIHICQTVLNENCFTYCIREWSWGNLCSSHWQRLGCNQYLYSLVEW